MPLQLIEEEIELYSRMAKAFQCGADALDCCVDSSLEFLELVNEKLQQHGYKVGVDYGVCQDVEAPSWHQTFFFLNYKIDFTYRQFDESCDFPRITKFRNHLLSQRLYGKSSNKIGATI